MGKIEVENKGRAQKVDVRIEHDQVDALVLGLRGLDAKDFRRAIASAKLYRRADARMEAQ